jgi:hypothetical protein
MLSIEYVHKRVRLFRIELRLVVVASILVLILVWQILRVLMVLK